MRTIGQSTFVYRRFSRTQRIIEPSIAIRILSTNDLSGYVRLPPHALNETHQDNDYPINTFYWFFESRKDPANAPLAIWLNGGPGGSSMIGALSENGPCFVSNDSRSTYLNPWSWNNEANLLFIDQPNQVGYSYDTPTNVTVDLANEGGLENGGINFADFSKGVPETNNTFLVGTVSSQNLSHTANSTQHAAVALWHFAQTWFEVSSNKGTIYYPRLTVCSRNFPSTSPTTSSSRSSQSPTAATTVQDSGTTSLIKMPRLRRARSLDTPSTLPLLV